MLKILSKIPIPVIAGKLVPADGKLNAPSGVALDASYLKPLGLKRSDVWLCDLAMSRSLSYKGPITGSALESVVIGDDDNATLLINLTGDTVYYGTEKGEEISN